ncbi:MAG: transcriptional regulator NrdR [Nanoarchaeota archaeon]|nr:transcriptional regulator NrdR [Nanoarchaeota archaeon]
MRCTFCEHKDTKVVDKRDLDSSTRRRRECLKCNQRFTTYENAETINLMIQKKDQRREQFNKEKLRMGLLKACEKRPIPVEKVDQIADRIEASLMQSKQKEIKSNMLGEKIMRELKKLDNVAYIRFASVYRDFKDINDFKKEIKGMK